MTEAKGGTLIALRVRDFRLYWSGLVAQVGGQHMFQFTLGWLAFEITGSQAQLALIHLCAFVPQFALTLLGGVLADRVDPRKLIGVAQSLNALTMLSLGTLSLPAPCAGLRRERRVRLRLVRPAAQPRPAASFPGGRPVVARLPH